MPHIESAGARIAYRWDGLAEGPVLVLSNSLGCDLGMWDEQVADLGGFFRILRYDTRGHGSSSTTPGEYDIALLGRDVLALLDGLNLASAHFCGLSLGGMTGQWLAANAPGRIDRLVLSSTAACMEAKDAWHARIRTVKQEGMSAVAGTIIERWFTAPFRNAEPTRVERILEMLLDAPPEGYVGCCAAVRDLDLRESLARIVAPTLVICGAQDVAIPPEKSRAMAAGVRGARVVELAGSHLCNIEARADFSRAVLEHLH
jgi:3-oxoadipate enol-lactonase